MCYGLSQFFGTMFFYKESRQIADKKRKMKKNVDIP